MIRGASKYDTKEDLWNSLKVHDVIVWKDPKWKMESMPIRGIEVMGFEVDDFNNRTLIWCRTPEFDELIGGESTKRFKYKKEVFFNSYDGFRALSKEKKEYMKKSYLQKEEEDAYMGGNENKENEQFDGWDYYNDSLDLDQQDSEFWDNI